MSTSNSHTFHFNDTSMAVYGIYVTGIDLDIMPQPRVDIQELGGGDGAVKQGNTFGPRYFTVSYTMDAGDWTTTLSNMSSIANVLKAGQTGDERKLQFDHFPGVEWYACCTSPLRSSMFQAGARGTLEFVASNPWAKASDYTTDTHNIEGTTIITGYTPSGEHVVDVEWTLKNGGAGACTDPTIYNDQTGDITQWYNTLSTDEWLRISGLDYTYTSSTDSGTNWSANWNGVTGSPPRIEGGVTNSITVLACSSGTLDIKYKPIYMGVSTG